MVENHTNAQAQTDESTDDTVTPVTPDTDKSTDDTVTPVTPDTETSMTEANNPDAHDDEPSQNDDCPECDDGTLYREPWITCGTERAFRNGKTGGLACTECHFAIRNGGHDPLDEDQVQCREDGCETAKPPVLLYDGRCGPCQRDHEYEQMDEEMEEANA